VVSENSQLLATDLLPTDHWPLTTVLALWLGVGVTLHLPRPLQKTPETVALAPEKFPKLKKTDLRHLDAAIGLDAPEQVGAPPRGQAMALGGVPEKA